MDADAAKTARESLDLAFQMSNILETGLDRHTLSILIALCDLGLNPEALAAVVKELRNDLGPPQDAAHDSLLVEKLKCVCGGMI
ncbi:mitotic-spindle organizing protein 1A-like isoform X1 [Argentina anserina]|uniref:mitotic-spindle organizing protein 1A-like isoform X1 n=1 Tax=Argentina anserina TaxID=57926 RepID=UPI0021768D5F|nr:mitotic-spindle organizing protein 1A-like isoform X1 [Potentilla anserina]